MFITLIDGGRLLQLGGGGGGEEGGEKEKKRGGEGKSHQGDFSKTIFRDVSLIFF